MVAVAVAVAVVVVLVSKHLESRSSFNYVDFFFIIFTFEKHVFYIVWSGRRIWHFRLEVWMLCKKSPLALHSQVWTPEARSKSEENDSWNVFWYVCSLTTSVWVNDLAIFVCFANLDSEGQT